jgi:hypothetical protein
MGSTRGLYARRKGVHSALLPTLLPKMELQQSGGESQQHGNDCKLPQALR